MIMTVVRKYHKSYLRVREGNFLLDGLLGFNLKDKTVGIVGTGRIGLLTGRILAKGFGCNVIAYDMYPNDRAGEYGISYVDSLEDLLAQADIISLHCPLTDGTRYMLNDRTLSKTKKGVILINTSRGALIDTHALIRYVSSTSPASLGCPNIEYRALKTGHLGAVALDVYEGEASYFFADSSSKIIQDDNIARLLTFYNVFIRYSFTFPSPSLLYRILTTVKWPPSLPHPRGAEGNCRDYHQELAGSREGGEVRE